MHYYKFHIGDYRRDTGHLSLIEHGIYRLLIDLYFLDESALTADKKQLARLVSVRTQDELFAMDNVLTDFFDLTDSGYTHKRCEVDLEAIYAKSEKARLAAKSRWSKDANAKQTHGVDDADALQTHEEHMQQGMQEAMPPIIPLPSNPLTHKYSVEDRATAEEILALIINIAPSTKTPNMDKWADTIRLMREADGLQHADIIRVFRWANSDSFWQSNILSISKLRKQYAQLRLKSEGGQNNESAYERVCRKSKEREEAGTVIDNTLALEAGF